MDEKDLNENEEKLTDINNDSVDFGLEEKDGVKYTAPVSYCPTDDKTVYVDMSALGVDRYYIVVPGNIMSEHGTKLS